MEKPNQIVFLQTSYVSNSENGIPKIWMQTGITWTTIHLCVLADWRGPVTFTWAARVYSRRNVAKKGRRWCSNEFERGQFLLDAVPDGKTPPRESVCVCACVKVVRLDSGVLLLDTFSGSWILPVIDDPDTGGAHKGKWPLSKYFCHL